MKFDDDAAGNMLACVLILLLLMLLVPTICYVTGAIAKCFVFALSLLLTYVFGNCISN